MKKVIYAIAVSLFMSFGIFAQETTTKPAMEKPEMTKEKKPRKPSFRATKEQVMTAQKMLKMTETGKNNPETKTAIKKYQADNGLKTTGTLNRETIEKMGIALTDKQKGISSMSDMKDGSKMSKDKMSGDKEKSKPKDDSMGDDKPKRKAPFRASKEQIVTVQKMLKVEETGKLDDTTREAIKKYQDSNAVKVTGTLNKETLMKMGVELTDKQKEY
jgi:peptidoglycan hydrolase-like protein with peptidoglycan-binding domain